MTLPPEIQQNVALAPYTTLGVGGAARWFAEARTEAEVESAFAFAHGYHLPIFVMGGGSNLLVSDAGFSGLVLRIATVGVQVETVDVPVNSDATNALVYVTAGAGEDWDRLVQLTVERNLGGMECLAGIPGTVGGTPVQNVGAYGQEISQTLVSLRCFDLQSRSFLELSNAQCGFGYRTSLLNNGQRGRYIVTRVTFALRPGASPNLSYGDLKQHFREDAHPTLAETAAAVRAIRRRKGMVVDAADPDSRSAGSFFRNPIVAGESLDRIARIVEVTPSQIPHWPAGTGCVKLPAAWLLEQAGFVRGYTMGRAGISTKHTLALVNRGDATEREVAALRDRIIAEVQQRFGVSLEQEPVSVGGASSSFSGLS